MTASQRSVLAALGRQPHTVASVAQRVDGRVNVVQDILNTLRLLGLVTLTPQGRWAATERGRKKAAA